ncbi:MAG TPA: hypothetical protein VFF12_13410 [Myxococcaceae bacterium]|nr:hypothetical protein [Myxococcaceae bacterium]
MMTVRYRKVLLAAACTLLPACWDLDLPSIPADGGVGPTLTIHSPLEKQTIPLNAPVSLDADSVNGVASVTVTCGGAPSTGVFTWNVPPYTGVVDFTRCTLVASGVADSGVGQLQLTFIGVDTLGHASTKSIDVFLDTSTASLSAVLPERVAPLSRLDLTVGSDRPLLLPPTVRLAGREADGIVQRANPDGGSPLYDVTFLKAPGLGIDNYGGDPFNVPFEVLVEVERSVSLTVDARATNGNASHLEQGVLLSRVLWDRIVPGRIAIDAAEPVATARGIQVALAKNTTVNAFSDWLPGFFRARDGTYVPFDPNSILVSGNPLPDPDAGFDTDGGSDAGNGGEGGTPDGGSDGGSDGGPLDSGVILADAGAAFTLPYALVIPDGGTIPFPQDGGFVAADFDGHGNVLFTRPNPSQRVGSDVIALGEPINGPRPATGFSVPFFLDSMQPDGGVTGPILTRMDDLVCIPDIVSPDGCFGGAPATHTVACVQAATGQLVLGNGDNNNTPGLDLVGPTPGGTAGAFGPVRTYLAPNDTATFCGPTWSTFAFPQSAFVPQPRTDTAFNGCTVLSVNRLLPIVDGSFALGVDLDCGVTGALPRWVVVHVSAAGAINGSYLAKVGIPLPSQPQVLGVLQGGTFGTQSALGAVVTMRNDPPYTTFEAFLPDGAAPVATARVPGLYVYGQAAQRLAKNIRSATDGSLSVLLNSATLGDVVLHFGPGLEPQWLYRYPRIAQNSSLIGGVDQGNVYYVDPFNNDIVALKRF